MDKKWVSISDVLFFQEGPGVRNTQYTTEGVKLLNVANLVDGNVDLSTSDRYISEEEAYGKYKHFLCDEGDFVVASSGIKVDYLEKKMGFIEKEMLPLCMNTSTIRFKVINEGKLDIRYFMYYAKSQHYKNQVAFHITGSAQLNYGPSHLKKMIMPLIPIEEQQDIVNILDVITRVIENRKKELIKLDELIKARFVEMFGNPNVEFKFKSHKFKEYASDMTKGPFGSDMKKDLYVPKGKDTYKVYIQINAIQGNQNLGDYYISKEYFEQKISRFEVQPGDFIITCDGTLGKHLKLDENMERGVISPSLLRLTLDESKMTQEYFEYMWDMYMLPLMKKEARNACLVHLPSAKVIGEVDIPVAPFELQREFSDFVKQVDKSKFVVQKSLEKYQLLFDSLMQEYFG